MGRIGRYLEFAGLACPVEDSTGQFQEFVVSPQSKFSRRVLGEALSDQLEIGAVERVESWVDAHTCFHHTRPFGIIAMAIEGSRIGLMGATYLAPHRYAREECRPKKNIF